MILSGKIKAERIISFFMSLFVFVLLIDSANVIFKIKLPLFILTFVPIILFYPKINKLIYVPIILYSIIIITSVIGLLNKYNTDYSFQLFFLQGFSMLLMLPWITRLRLIEKCVFPAIVMAIIVLSLFVIFIGSNTTLATGIYSVLSNEFEGILMIGKRTFIGIDITAVYYSSAPVLLIVFAYYFHKLMFIREQRGRWVFISLFLAVPLLFGGVRAMVLSFFAIIYLIIIIKLWSLKKWQIFAAFALFLGLCAGVFMLVILLLDKGETSLEVKQVLLNAFYNHVWKYPETLIWGNGVGATFDSLGVRGFNAIQSEWTYLELIRWFGLPLAIVFMLVYIYPIYILFRKRKTQDYAMIISYIFFLLLAGTNPYLYSSNGMLALLLMYNYSLNPYYDTNTAK